MKKEYSLTSGSVLGSMLRFAFPVLLASILQVLYSAVDMWVVGHFGTTADVSAVSISGQIMSTVTLVVSGFTTGTTVLLGQYCGAKNEKGMRDVVGSSIVFFALVAVGLMVPLLALNHRIIDLMHTRQEAVVPAQQYLFICSGGIIFILGYNLLSAIMRGMGNSRAPLLFVSVSTGINVIVDVTLVKYFHMGAAGTALATVGAQAGSMVFAILFLRHRGLGFPFSFRDIRLRKSVVRPVFKVGLPLSLQELLVCLSFMLITYVVNGIGLAESAAVGVVEKLITFLSMPTFAMSASVSTMSAHNIGARQFARARRCLLCGICCAASVALAFNIFTFFNGRMLVGLFTVDPAVREVGSQYVKSYGLDLIMLALVFNFNGFFSGCNHTTFSMIHSLFATLCIRVPVVYLMSRAANVTLFKIGLASPIASFSSVILCVLYLIWIRRHETDEQMIIK